MVSMAACYVAVVPLALYRLAVAGCWLILCAVAVAAVAAVPLLL
jgi:hypothetical protein